jgi:predicted alpha/beta hydrolase family esterase
LSENTFPKKIKQLHLVCPVFNEEYPLISSETLGNFVLDPGKLKNISPQVEEIFIYHSKDDPLIPYSHSEQYKKHLPTAKLTLFEDRGHFQVSEFPELLENINLLQ